MSENTNNQFYSAIAMDFAKKKEEERRAREKARAIAKAKEFVSVEKVSRMLKEKGIKVPDDFVSRIPSGVSPIRAKDVKELLKIANFWRPVIRPEGFDDFVVKMVMKFMVIHAVAINNNPSCDKLYIGCKAELKEEVHEKGVVIANVLITTVLSSGGNAGFVDTPTRFRFD